MTQTSPHFHKIGDDERAPPVDLTPVRILLVDDKRENLVALEAALARPDYQLVSVMSGNEALQALLGGDFAVLLLDILMPGMDGFELARLIRTRERTRDIPILFLTALGCEHEYISRGYSAGAVDYMAKPLDMDVLRAKVGAFVDLYRKKRRQMREQELLRQIERDEQEQKIAEIRGESERRYRRLAESLPLVVWVANRDGAVTYLNDRWREFSGRSAGELAGWDWLELLHPDDKPRVGARFRAAIEHQEGFGVECRLRVATDGSYRWQLCRVAPDRDERGAVTAWIGTFTDLEEPERELQRRDTLLGAALLLADVAGAPREPAVSDLGRVVQEVVERGDRHVVATVPTEPAMVRGSEPLLSQLVALLCDWARDAGAPTPIALSVETPAEEPASVHLSLRLSHLDGPANTLLADAARACAERRFAGPEAPLHLAARTASALGAAFTIQEAPGAMVHALLALPRARLD